MAITQLIVTPPTIKITGTVATVDAKGNVTAKTAYENTAVSEFLTTSLASQDANKSYSHTGPIYVYGPVTVTLETGYTTTNWGTYTGSLDVYTDAARSRTILGGDPALDSLNQDKAAIYMTLNGKDPKRTKNYIYRGAFTLNNNFANSDNTIIKARVYYAGEMSVVNQIALIILSSDTTNRTFYKV